MMKWVLGACLGFFVVSGVSFGQQAGSKAAYRAMLKSQQDSALFEADWNEAKKLSANIVEPNSFKDAKQDFHSFETASGIGFAQQMPFKVYSVVDPSNVILSFDGSLLWLQGASTGGLHIGDSIRILNPISFGPPKPYQDKPIRSAKTMTGAEFDTIQKKIARDKRKEKSQVFELSDGKTIEAVFVDVRKGKAILEDLDGASLEHALTEFSAKSASTIRELFKKKPKETKPK